MFVRLPDADLPLPICRICILPLPPMDGDEYFAEKERVKIDSMMGHGGFKARVLDKVRSCPEYVCQCNGDDRRRRPWGMALLAAYMVNKDDGETLEDYLAKKVFADKAVSQIEPDIKDVRFQSVH